MRMNITHYVLQRILHSGFLYTILDDPYKLPTDGEKLLSHSEWLKHVEIIK